MADVNTLNPESGNGQNSGETFKEVLEALREVRRIQQETALQMKETDRRMKETDKRIGDLGNRFGEMVEHLVAPSINEKFNELGFSFDTVSQNIQITDSSGNFLAEIDLLLENGDIAIAVEVKAKPSEKDVDQHINRMEVLRSRAYIKNDNRKFQGAIAGAVMNKEVLNYAHEAGFYVIEQTGDTVKISIPEGFVPREW